MENLVKKYRVLDPHGKEMVDFTLGKKRERSKQLRETPIYNFESESLMVAESYEYEVSAAHAIPNASFEDKQHDKDIMNDENF